MTIRPIAADVPCEQTDRQTGRHNEANSRFSPLCERA